jgi:hypothetical protein
MTSNTVERNREMPVWLSIDNKIMKNLAVGVASTHQLLNAASIDNQVGSNR